MILVSRSFAVVLFCFCLECIFCSSFGKLRDPENTPNPNYSDVWSNVSNPESAEIKKKPTPPSPFSNNVNDIPLADSDFYSAISDADKSESRNFFNRLVYKQPQNKVREMKYSEHEDDGLLHSEKSQTVKLAWEDLFGSYALTNVLKSKEIFKEYIKIGNPMAHTGLGIMYASGIGIDYSPARSLIHLTFGAVNDNYLGYVSLAYRYFKGINVLPSCEIALTLYKKVAREVMFQKKGLHNSQKQFIRLLDEEEGYSNRKTDEDIVTYYHTLADRGDHPAQALLGILYYRGEKGLQKNVEKALYYLKQAADGDNRNVDTYAYLGMIYLEGFYGVESDYKLALSYLRQAVEMESRLGQFYLGLMHLLGKGTPKNVKAGLVYVTLAAERGLIDAVLQLGLMHMVGFGIQRDFTIAYNYISMAAEAGNVLAYYYLGQIYDQGIGMKRSCLYAVHNFKIVAEQGEWSEYFSAAYNEYKNYNYKSSHLQYAYLAELGFEVAQSNAAFLLEKMHIQSSSALTYWSRSADQGYSMAHIKLGDFFFYGEITQTDYEIAANHYKLAWEQEKNARGIFNLGYMYEHGYGTQRDLKHAMRCYQMAIEASDDAFIPVSFVLMKLKIIEFAYELWSNFESRVLLYNFDIVLLLVIPLLYCLFSRYFSQN